MIQRLRSSTGFYDPCLGLSVRATGSDCDLARYFQQLAPPQCLKWHDRTTETTGLELSVELCGESPIPPVDAVESHGLRFTKDAVYFPVERDWLRLESTGATKWNVTRCGTRGGVRVEHAIFSIAALRNRAAPLHCSVFRYRGIGVACIGGEGSGKTALLLSMMQLGAEWICDDQAYCSTDLRTAYGRSPTMDVKLCYLRQLPKLHRDVSRSARWNLGANSACRRAAGIVSRCTPLPNKVRNRLRRIAAGHPTVRLSPPNHRDSTQVDMAILVAAGEKSRLEEQPSNEWAEAATQVMWPEVRSLHEIHRQGRGATGAELLQGEADDEQRLRTYLTGFAATKRTYRLVRSPSLPLINLAELLLPAVNATRGSAASHSADWIENNQTRKQVMQ